jgi:hypothetical protein
MGQPWSTSAATWASSGTTWTGQAPGPRPSTRTPRANFLLSGWYLNQQEDFQDVIDFAEGRGDPFYV